MSVFSSACQIAATYPTNICRRRWQGEKLFPHCKVNVTITSAFKLLINWPISACEISTVDYDYHAIVKKNVSRLGCQK